MKIYVQYYSIALDKIQQKNESNIEEKEEDSKKSDELNENKNIENATALVLIDCIETIEPMGQTPLRYQVYAIVKNELILID